MFGKGKVLLGLLVSLTATSVALSENGATKVMPTPPPPSPIINNPSKSDGASDTGIIAPSQISEPKLKVTSVATEGKATIGSLNDAQLEKKVAEILTKNPEIIVEALQKFSERQEKVQQEKMEVSLMKYQGEIANESNAAVLGRRDAEVKLVVFVDPNCPHCRPFTQALNKIRDDFPNVAIFVRPWPILGKDSEDVVRGLWAIKQQGQDKFNAAVKAISASDERYTFLKLLAWVEDHSLDTAKFKTDAESSATKAVIEETSKLAKNIGLQGTPTSLLIDKKGNIKLVIPTDEKSLTAILQNASKA